MLHVQYKHIKTPFKHPFRTAHGVKTHQEALLIRMSVGPYSGMGEAPAIHYYDVSVEKMISELEQKMPILSRYAFTEPERFWHFCHHLFPHNSFLICALDMAYWNMYAMRQQKSIRALWNLPDSKGPITDLTIGIDDKEAMCDKISANPWPVYKIKVASVSDIDTLQALRKVTKSPFRIDANAAWSVEDACMILPQLENLGIEWVEQPLAKDNLEGMLVLKEKTSIPFIADESCVGEEDVMKCAPYFDGINIKLTKCGGLTPARRMIDEARSKNLQIMMGCMNETEVGTEAMMHFLPLLDYADMDGPLLLDIPVLQRIAYEQAHLIWKV